MRFRKTATPPPYLNSRHQRRLLMLVGLLAMVLVAMNLAAKPSTWNWLFVGQRAETKPSNEQGTAKTEQPAVQLKSGEFRARITKAEQGTTKLPAGDSHLAVSTKSSASDTETVDLTIPPELLAHIEDGSYAVPFKELDGFYGILARVAKLPRQSLRDAAKRTGSVPFSVLLNEPKTYRGQVMSIEGKLGSLRKLPDTRKELGLGTLYEAWIVTPESDNNPYRVVLSELPVGLQPQGRYEKPPQVRATGYLFKIQRYEVTDDDDQNHRAPLILAKRIQVLDPRESQGKPAGLAPYVIGFALLLGAILALTLWRLSSGDKKFTETQLKRFDTTQSADVSEMKRLDAADEQAEFLRQLGESEPPPSS